MAIKTPQITSPAHEAPAIEAGPARSGTTSSRAVSPAVRVTNKRLAEKGYGEAFLVWRCVDCGAAGHLDELPEACPECELPREYIGYEIED